MKTIAVALLAIFVSVLGVAGAAHAMDGVFDRSEETLRYLQIIQTGSEDAATVAAIDIYYSGISDARLAAAVNERLLKDYAAITQVKHNHINPPPFVQSALGGRVSDLNKGYGVCLIRALASFGIAQYGQILKRIATNDAYGARSTEVRLAAKDASDAIAFHRVKNEIMASRSNHSEGDDPKISRLVNLLLASDLQYRRAAVQQISWQHIQDARLLDVLARQVADYVEHTSGVKNRTADNLIAENIRLLGLSGNSAYRDVLQKVVSSNAVAGLKKHASVALAELH